MIAKEITKYRRLLKMYYMKRCGFSDASIGRMMRVSRERVGQLLKSLNDLHPEGLAQIDLFIREREPISGIIFLEAIKNPVTLKSLIEKLLQ